MAVVDNGWESQGSNFVQATYAYLSSGENQLSFHEGDTIAISGMYIIILLLYNRSNARLFLITNENTRTMTRRT